ncbi:MAG TPA: threonine/serine dehydratase [Gemmatimonadales bacterium]|nr:threonine/serine dehydratase [Gemmatimonadales bacterium]
MTGITHLSIDRERISATETAIRPHIRRTPVLHLPGTELGARAGRVSLKLELLQHSGSFKARGAFANLLLRPVPAGGVVAASGGNHGAAVAYAAQVLGHAATIFIPSIASPAKVERIRGYGATLMIAGKDYDDALRASELWASGHDALRVHAFDQEETLCGQGTLALELEEQAPDLDSLLLPIGGGGLLGGTAAWYGGKVRLIAVEPEGCPTLTRAWAAGRPVDAEVGGIAADSLGPRRVGERTYSLIRERLEQVVLVSDADIHAAQLALWNRLRIVAEPGGATAFAALLSGKYRPRIGERTGVVISGGNTVAVNFDR